jgi:hypothetical protein
MKATISWKWLACVLLLVGATSQAAAQVNRFRFRPELVPVGRLYRFDKSNIDGTHKGEILLYVAARDRLEAWKPGEQWSTLVTADMDWNRFSVHRFESWRHPAAGKPELIATLDLPPGGNQGQVTLRGQSFPTEIRNWPAHSYDFDFGSLNLTLAHVIDAKKPFTVTVADFAMKDGKPAFVEKGPIELAYEGEEKRQDVRSRRYRIDGPGLENRGGKMWVDARRNHVVDYEIAIPDEEGFNSVKLALKSFESMTPDAWQRLTGRK